MRTNATIDTALARMARRAQFFSGAEGTEDTDTDTVIEFSLPEDLTTLSDEDVIALHDEAVGHFNDTYNGGVGITAEVLKTLNVLQEAVAVLATEKETREANAATLAAEAAELAGKVGGTPAVEPEATEDGQLGDKSKSEKDDDEEDEKLAGKRTLRIPAKGGQSGAQAAAARTPVETKKSVKDVLSLRGEKHELPDGTPVDFLGMGEALNNRLNKFNVGTYQKASDRNQLLREVGQLGMIRREFADEQIIKSNDRNHVESVLKAASALANMKQRTSLLASGGWFAPSEVLYNEFLQLEASAGGLSTPEVTLARGSVQVTPGISFQEIFSAIGFAYTAEEDEEGRYQDDSGELVEGEKPVYRAPAPEFDTYTLDVLGLIIEAGLLPARGYPEYLADIIRKALVAHFHKMNAHKIADIASYSDPVSIPGPQAGAIAPLLSAIELQATHIRDTHRMDPDAVLEGVFPFWIVGALRSDLSRRLGVDMISVPDSRLVGWFTDRKIAPQFIQDFQSIATTPKANFTAWPTSVEFFLYPAGTFVTAKSEVLTIDTLYDSVLLKRNDFMALFTEEAQTVVKIGPDSRRITVPITPSGSTHIGDEIAANGTFA